MSFFFSPVHTHALESLILNSFFLYSEPCTIKLPNWSHSVRIKHPRAQDPAKDLFQEHLPLLHICCISHWCSPGLWKLWKVPVWSSGNEVATTDFHIPHCSGGFSGCSQCAQLGDLLICLLQRNYLTHIKCEETRISAQRWKK